MRKLLLIVLATGLIACNESKPDEKILPVEVFEQMLYEVHIADVMLKQKNKSDRQLKGIYESYYNHIFLKHEITPGDFEANIRYYSVKTDDYRAMYDRILNRLVNEKNVLQQVDTANKKPEIIKPIK